MAIENDTNKGIGPQQEDTSTNLIDKKANTDLINKKEISKQWWKKRDAAEEARIDNMRDKWATKSPSFSYKQHIDKNNTIQLGVDKFDDNTLTNEQKANIQQATLFAATGSTHENFAQLLFSQSIAASISSGHDTAFIANAYNGALLSMAPQDEFEGMLISRLLALNNQIMYFLMKSAASEQNNMPSAATTDMYINRVSKLTRLYNETLDTLNRHRRKGEQKVTVQHVNVNSGGQAVVTGQFTPGGDVNKK